MSETKTIDQILDQFLDVNQQTFTELEQLDKVIENVEIVLIPIERRYVVKIQEHVKNSIQVHQKHRSLEMKDVDFDQHIKNSIPSAAWLRQYDQRNLTPDTIERILENHGQIKEDNQEAK